MSIKSCNDRHSLVASSAPTIPRPWVQIPSTPQCFCFIKRLTAQFSPFGNLLLQNFRELVFSVLIKPLIVPNQGARSLFAGRSHPTPEICAQNSIIILIYYLIIFVSRQDCRKRNLIVLM